MRNVGKFELMNINTISTQFGTYNKRHLMQLIRRKMTVKVIESKKKYNRKQKHKKNWSE